MKIFKKLLSKANMAFYTLLAFSLQVRAEIPETDDFADGAEDRGGIDTLFWLLEKFVQLVVIALAAYFVIIIGKAAIAKYNDITDGRGNWMDLGGHIIGGVALLTLTIIMLNWIGTWVE